MNISILKNAIDGDWFFRPEREQKRPPIRSGAAANGLDAKRQLAPVQIETFARRFSMILTLVTVNAGSACRCAQTELRTSRPRSDNSGAYHIINHFRGPGAFCFVYLQILIYDYLDYKDSSDDFTA